jgi:hypothetical protein
MPIQNDKGLSMSEHDHFWEYDGEIPSNVTYEELIYSFLHHTRTHIVKTGYALQMSEFMVEKDMMSKEQLLSALVEGRRNQEAVWRFVQKVDAFLKSKRLAASNIDESSSRENVDS